MRCEGSNVIAAGGVGAVVVTVVVGNTVVEVVLQDVAGNFTAKQLVHTYCKQADCIVLCYSLTSKESFKGL